MSKLNINVPRSISFYFEHQKALDAFDYVQEPCQKYGMDDFVGFYKAKASFSACQYDYYMLMVSLWKSTWGRALEKYDGVLSLMDFQQMVKLPKDWGINLNKWASIDAVWEESRFWWPCRIKTGSKQHVVCLGCAEGERHVRLFWSILEPLDKGKKFGFVKDSLDCLNKNCYWEERPDDCNDVHLLEKHGVEIKIGKQQISIEKLAEIANETIENIVKQYAHQHEEQA